MGGPLERVGASERMHAVHPFSLSPEIVLASCQGEGAAPHHAAAVVPERSPAQHGGVDVKVPLGLAVFYRDMTE